jgi:hypothetical protein
VSRGTRHSFVVGCVVVAFNCSGLAAAPAASATPSDDANFLNAVYPYAHPQVSPQNLVRLGHQACAVRRAGGNTGDAKVSVSQTLWAQGVMSSNAEVGSLVHAAVDTLCPEVGYP